MPYDFKQVHDLESLMHYCSCELNWPIDVEWLDEIDDIVYDLSADDLGIKESEFPQIVSVKQLRPFYENQPWGIFAVCFDSKTIEVSAIRRILRSLIPTKNSMDKKTWDYKHLLFVCFWGENTYRTVGFIGFEDNENGLPYIKSVYCAPQVEERNQIENVETKIKKLSWPADCENSTWIEEWINDQALRNRQVIRDTQSLTQILAEKAFEIASTIEESLRIESSAGRTFQLYKRFTDALQISLSEKQFADMYAQTIVYGLFSARCLKPEVDTFDAEIATECIPETNPLLKALLIEYFSSSAETKYDEFDVSSIIATLNSTDIGSILADFNRQTGLGKEDPIVYFYEKFLDYYEKEEKKRRGVYYTPMPTVNFMVRAVSHLLKNRFAVSQGYLDKNVSILDPAAGTGTFLRKIILTAKEECDSQDSERRISWNDFINDNLLPRLFGFEFMMAPYAVAHMKLAMTLKETGYSFCEGHRLNVFLANALECNGNTILPLLNNDPLQKETIQANAVHDKHVNVIIGNPPYRTDSVNQGEWIMRLMEDYKKEPCSLEKLHERNPKVINDDYVKFIRFAQEILSKEAHAIIAYVLPHSYTDNLTFRGMRWQLLQEFDSIYIFDLHGNVMSRESTDQAERDENIFDIQQGVCISFFVKDGSRKGQDAEIYYSDIFGSRERKYGYLQTTSFEDIQWSIVTPLAPHYFFKPKDLSQKDEYERGVDLSKLFPINIAGVKTHSDDTLISSLPFDTGYDQLYDYRPFDIKHINYDLTKVKRHRNEVMKHFIGHENLGLVINRQVVTDNWSHVQVVRNMVDNRLHYSRKGIPVECPMFLYDDNNVRTPNVNRDLLAQFEVSTGLEFSNELTDDPDKIDIMDLMDYCYGILFSQDYRDKYRELLSIDFPRVPFPVSLDMFCDVVQIGKELRLLHLLETPVENGLGIELDGIGNNMITNVTYCPEQQSVRINGTQSFINVSADVWDYCFGGYHGMQKWLKDRKQTVLSVNDIDHFISVCNVFSRSITLSGSMNDVLSRYGVL